MGLFLLRIPPLPPKEFPMQAIGTTILPMQSLADEVGDVVFGDPTRKVGRKEKKLLVMGFNEGRHGEWKVWGGASSRKVWAELGILQGLWPTSPKAPEAKALGEFRAGRRKGAHRWKRKKAKVGWVRPTTS